MTDTQPTPPSDLPNDVVDALENLSPELLRGVASYATDLAAWREREQRRGGADDSVDDSVDDRPDGVPSKATLTVKEINDNRYYYWQWRDGDHVRSQYEAPVNPSG